MTKTKKKTRMLAKGAAMPYIFHFLAFTGVFMVIVTLALFTINATSAAPL